MGKVTVGSKVRCIYADTKFYEHGKVYKVTEQNGFLGTVGEDGIFDKLGETSSTFEVVTPSSTKLKIVHPK